jgi:hypothetical protein
MAFTMAYPNFKKGLKMAFGSLGVNFWTLKVEARIAFLDPCPRMYSILTFV